MKLSVIIVSYNSVHFLRLTLSSVFTACKDIEAEVFVVDNHSQDNTTEMVKNEFPLCKLITNKTNPGFAIANNLAIQKAKGQYVLILNPDTILGEDCLKRALSFIENKPRAAGLGIRMLDGSGCFLPESKRGIPSPWVSFTKITGLSSMFPNSRYFGNYHKGYLHEKENHPIEILSGAFMLFKRDVLNHIGLLDEAFFMYGEDIDLSYRAIKNGYQNYYFSDVSIIHFKGESTVKDQTYVNRFHKAMIQFSWKHFSKSYGFLFKILIHTGIYIIRLFSYLKNHRSQSQQAADKPDKRILILKSQLPSQDVIQILRKKFEVCIIKNLAKSKGGTLVFVQGIVSYSEMIHTMDTYKKKFKYRFLDPQKLMMIGSDHAFNTGLTLRL